VSKVACIRHLNQDETRISQYAYRGKNVLRGVLTAFEIAGGIDALIHLLVLVSLLCQFSCSSFSFLCEFCRFFHLLTDRLDLARVSLALWTCSAAGEEPLTIVAPEERRVNDAHDKKPKADLQSPLGLPSVPSSKAQSDFAIFQSDFALQINT
jgi:hypothetical protein